MPKEYDAAKGRPAGAGNRLAGELSLREKYYCEKNPISRRKQRYFIRASQFTATKPRHTPFQV